MLSLRHPILWLLFLLANLANSLPEKGRIIYNNPLNSIQAVSQWTMEGPGEVMFSQGWMTMFSANKAMHHVFWCPEDFPASFVAQWEAQNLDTDAGLAIVFFAAAGLNSEDIFDSQLTPRDGSFNQYTLGDIRSYHISYYANAAHNRNRGHANLRKNNTFTLLQKGEEGIPSVSRSIHQLRLVKQGLAISFWVNNKKVIDYRDSAPVWGSGKIGLRQMKWSKFRYRNFKVWQLINSP